MLIFVHQKADELSSIIMIVIYDDIINVETYFTALNSFT